MKIMISRKYLKFGQITLFLVFILFLIPFPSKMTIGAYRNQINLIKEFPDQILLENGLPEEGIFSNSSSSHNWKVNDVNNGQIVYFSISPKTPVSFTKSDFTVGLYKTSGGLSYNSELQEQLGSNAYLASWKVIGTGDWIIQVNDTRIVKNENASYEIIVSIPEVGYDETSARKIPESFVYANFTIQHEIHFWEIYLNKNQNGTLMLKELESGVLFEALITVYPKSYPNNPVLPSTEIQGPFNYSWNAFAADDYIIRIVHKAQDITPIGIYLIAFPVEKELFDFETAGELHFNQTISILKNLGFVSPKEYFFTFYINSSRSKVNLRIFETTDTPSEILEGTEVKIYDVGKQNLIDSWQEGEQFNDGEFNISLTLNEGKYYLIVSTRLESVGTFSIHFDYQLPQAFTWDIFSIFLSAAVLAILPVYLIYLDSRGKWLQTNQWTIPISVKEAYKLFKYSFSGIFNIKEIPNESILIRVASIPFNTFTILNFLESSEEETLIFSKRIKRRIEWIIYFLIGLIVFDALNLFSFLSFSVHILPFYFSDIKDLLLILFVPTVILTIIVLFVNVSTYITYNQVVHRIAYVIENYKGTTTEMKIQSLNSEQASKSINYVRVLWNQAKHAFKDNNFELFVIKADAAVKNLVSTRFLQMINRKDYTKPDFQVQVTELRKHGFDLPNDRKIAHYRNLRNRIVHSSVTLDEKESVNCFAYYSTFITRLGLRPS